jgi:threonine synthase
MKFASTRGEAPAAGFSQAILQGLAPDGGLYVPERFPRLDPASFDDVESLPAFAGSFLAPFLEGDDLARDLPEICAAAFDFPLRLRALDATTSVLELFHGPTAAFKDFGARFLAECFARIVAGGRTMTILVATSGDTGGAVAAAFHRKPGIRVGILFPRDGVSPRQRKHLTCWDDNVRSFAVRGNFDDCQRVVKEAFRDSAWRREAGLTSANSINIGRLLPQAVYYAIVAERQRRLQGTQPGFVVPSGNMGNAVGAFWAKRIGFPVGRVALACNANRTVPDWFADGRWTPRPSVATLANAMDVGDPSNMERLFHLYPEREALLADASAMSVDDATIRREIADGVQRWGSIWCPHTATAVHYHRHLTRGHWILVATAHPSKFEETVEPLIGRVVEVPEPLARLLAREERVTEIDADARDLRRGLES